MDFAEMSRDGAQLRMAARDLDHCSSKKVDFPQEKVTSFSNRLGRSSRMLQIVCHKYPEGTEFVVEENSHNAVARGRAAMRLGCIACEFKNGNPEQAKLEAHADAMHEKIRSTAGKLYVQGNHSEAVLRGLLIVKETLREVSDGYESAADAVGKGGLYFVTPRGSHVEKAYQQAAQFSLMAVDNLRNVEAHSLAHDDEVAQGPQYSYPRLMLCSLALSFLDNTEIRI